MRSRLLRTWFLCTLVVIGMLPMPAAVAGTGSSTSCCTPAASPETAAVAEVAAPATSCCGGAMTNGVDACSADAADAAEAAAPVGTDAEAADAHPACGDCEDCGTRACRCGQCGCQPPSVLPAVGTPMTTLAPIVPAASIRVPERACRALAAAGGLLRPPRS